MKSLSTLLALFLLATSAGATPPPWTPPQIQPGVAGFTCISATGNPAEPVFAMVDLRDPLGCAAPPIPSNWTAATTTPRKYWQAGWDLATMSIQAAAIRCAPSTTAR